MALRVGEQETSGRFTITRESNIEAYAVNSEERLGQLLGFPLQRTQPYYSVYTAHGWQINTDGGWHFYAAFSLKDAREQAQFYEEYLIRCFSDCECGYYGYTGKVEGVANAIA